MCVVFVKHISIYQQIFSLLLGIEYFNTSETSEDDILRLSELDLRREDHRKLTLELFPIKRKEDDVKRAARNGFYYNGKGNNLRCAFCKIELRNWEETDDQLTEHKALSPNCPNALRKPVGNVPSGSARSIELFEKSRPANTFYNSKVARRHSFRTWPKRMKQTPDDLADAGFYHAKTGDKALCFSCGGGVSNWEDEDDPWEEHARWFNNCPYLNYMKGEEFVAKVMKKFYPSKKFRNNPQQSSHSMSESIKVEQMEVDTEKEVNEHICKMCNTAYANVCFVPCGHVLVCKDCGLKMSTCLICRQPFESLLQIIYD